MPVKRIKKVIRRAASAFTDSQVKKAASNSGPTSDRRGRANFSHRRNKKSRGEGS